MSGMPIARVAGIWFFHLEQCLAYSQCSISVYWMMNGTRRWQLVPPIAKAAEEQLWTRSPACHVHNSKTSQPQWCSVAVTLHLLVTIRATPWSLKGQVQCRWMRTLGPKHLLPCAGCGEERTNRRASP